MLLLRGPIYFGWNKTWGKSLTLNGYGHASVIVGVDTDTGHITYHDPEDGPNRMMTLQAFNKYLQRHKYALLYKL